MGDVREFPVKQTALEQIAKDLIGDKKQIRTAVVVTRKKDDSLDIQLYFPDGAPDDLLAIKHIVGQLVDSLWAKEFEVG